MKQVIFIGGSSFSGSTFLNLILANAPDAFSCGEVAMYFRPPKHKYLEPDCSCGDPNCTVWPQLKDGGEANLYQNIFNRFPHINVIVDSSKNPIWIRDMSSHLSESGIHYKNILIWKTPEEYMQSWFKRGRKYGWRRSWVNYHRSYFRLIDDWVAIKYSDIAKNPTLLQLLCSYLNITYHEGQEQYWNKTHHSLFGNSSANIHLHQQNSKAFDYYQKEIKNSWSDYKLEGSMHQKIKYEAEASNHSKVEITTENDEFVQRIVKVLEARDFRTAKNDPPSIEIQAEIDRLKAITIWPMLKWAKYVVQSLTVRF